MPGQFATGMWLWITGLTSFYCAYTLRKLIVRDELQNPIS